jgi:hypothetical protein
MNTFSVVPSPKVIMPTNIMYPCFNIWVNLEWGWCFLFEC